MRVPASRRTRTHTHTHTHVLCGTVKCYVTSVVFVSRAAQSFICKAILWCAEYVLLYIRCFIFFQLNTPSFSCRGYFVPPFHPHPTPFFFFFSFVPSYLPSFLFIFYVVVFYFFSFSLCFFFGFFRPVCLHIFLSPAYSASVSPTVTVEGRVDRGWTKEVRVGVGVHLCYNGLTTPWFGRYCSLTLLPFYCRQDHQRRRGAGQSCLVSIWPSF